jgi:hypothetical protein
MAKNSQQVAKKWVSKMSGASEAYKQGIESVQRSPGEAAAAAVPRMIQKLMEMHESGELQRRMASVGLAEWKEAAKNKGASRLASGAAAAEGDFANFMSEFLPFVENVKQNLPERGDFNQNMQRMLANAEALHKFKRSR